MVKLNALRIRFGFSFQNSALYNSMNVYQNLTVPLTMNVKNLNKAKTGQAVDDVL
jgi:phospholipid/cholesterol/gamma-HCH transport system ATP-binding protein